MIFSNPAIQILFMRTVFVRKLSLRSVRSVSTRSANGATTRSEA